MEISKESGKDHCDDEEYATRSSWSPFARLRLPLARDQPGFLLETYRRYGKVVRFDFLGFHGALLDGAEANRYILIDAVDNFQVGPVIDRARARWIVGQGILFIDEPEHRQQRRLMLPSMHRKRIGA